eukprot:TRINITY_DN19736_c0_g1_i1.p1 TRINITY_DN19736_c0_g1~~TRINITY_DN19736_c0_g1_i1.p1  ORF type:complete len:492 (-),score=129.36 TRINITY_DN19736_c0_g1_i1:185-1660(-)
MGLFGGDNELGNMLQEAVKIKSHQMDQKRKTYSTWPFFVQHTLFQGEKEHLSAWRQLPFDEKIEKAEELKEKGNKLYSEKNWSDAIDRYEEAGGMIYYCYSDDPGWRKNNRGIDDDVIHLVDDRGSTPDEAEQHRKLRLSCCLNIAACKLQLQKYDEVIVACNTALQLDDKNVKALYRRAEARIRPSAATAYDHDCAIKDLAKANAVDPKNTAVSRLLTDLRAERKVQRAKDQKTFTGLFDRGELYDQAVVAAAAAAKPGAAPQPVGGPSMDDIQSRINEISDDDPLEKRCADAELLRDLYMRNGKEEEARELNEKIQAAKRQLENRDQEPPACDWENPTQDMIDDAKKYDLDLTDPLVVQELKRLQKEGIDSMPAHLLEGDGDASEPALRPSTAAGSTGTSGGAGSDLPLPDVDLSVPTPWLRYVVFFGCMFLVFKMFSSGLLRLLAVMAWQMVAGGPKRVADDDEAGSRPNVLMDAYRSLTGKAEDAEL